jgi:hypothetical protein
LEALNKIDDIEPSLTPQNDLRKSQKRTVLAKDRSSNNSIFKKKSSMEVIEA